MDKSIYSVLQRGSGFRWQSNWSGEGQQHDHAGRYGIVKAGLQTVYEPGRNLIEPQMRDGGVGSASDSTFENCDVYRNPFSRSGNNGIN
ncbi:MAG TPA: hypothetical protein VKR82_12530 [Candidatus Acidoferrales bacterium]|nr:hypothetical protein [Candidatus Acidoferrales bacterium]